MGLYRSLPGAAKCPSSARLRLPSTDLKYDLHPPFHSQMGGHCGPYCPPPTPQRICHQQILPIFSKKDLFVYQK